MTTIQDVPRALVPDSLREWLAAPKRLLIGDEWTAAEDGAELPSINPSTGEQQATFAAGSTADVDKAVAAARAAFEGPWSRTKPAERQRLLLRFADLIDEHVGELTLLDALDMGRPVSTPAAFGDSLRYFAGWATKIHGQTMQPSGPGDVWAYTTREPVGVVGSIIPWNGPASSSIGKIGPAIATGCTVVLKPSEEASLSPLRVVELALEAGFPEGVLNVVTGTGAGAGAALAAHPGVDKVAFTGSVATGQRIIEASIGNLKRVSLELGGKSPNIIFADADLQAAGKAAAMAVFRNSGQVCVAGTRLFVEHGVHDRIVEHVAEVAESLVVGNSLDRTTQMGPLVSRRQLDRVLGYVDSGLGEGAELATGGKRLTDGDRDRGNFVAPTVFAGVADDMQIAREEIFGPVVSVLRFDEVDDLIRRANATSFGLASGVWTRDIGKAHRVARAIKAGSVWVNTYMQFDPAVPFGGYKMSGWGRELGAESLEEYLQTKSTWLDLA